MTRLIDADALKESFCEGAFTTRGVREIIDNAPTVEPKKGKWKKRHENSYECPFCGEENFYAYDEVLGKFNDNFCPNCGADMRETDNGKS